MTKLRTFWKSDESERGDEMVEFAVVGVVLLTCLFGIMDCSRALYTYHFTSYAAREATRYAMVRGSTWAGTGCATTATVVCDATNANVLSYVQSVVPPGIDSGASLSVTTTWPGTGLAGSACSTSNGNNSPGCLVMVQVSYSFKYILPFLPTGALTLKSTSEVVIQQ